MDIVDIIYEMNQEKENSIKNISDDICNNIIAELILSEIKDKKKC